MSGMTELLLVETVEILEVGETEILELIEPGPQGKPGLAGASGGEPYIHEQSVAAAMWDISHDLGRYPNVAVVDDDNREILADVQWVDQDRVVVRLNEAITGKAFLS